MAIQNISFGQAFNPNQIFNPSLMGTFTPGEMGIGSAGQNMGNQVQGSAGQMGSTNMGASTANGIQQNQPRAGGPGAQSPGNIMQQGLMTRFQQPQMVSQGAMYPGGNAQAVSTTNSPGPGGASQGAIQNANILTAGPSSATRMPNGTYPSSSGTSGGFNPSQLAGIQAGMGLMAAAHQRGASTSAQAAQSAAALGKLLSQYNIQGLMGGSGS